MNKGSGKMNSLQLLRAIAALLVVYCHLLDRQPLANNGEKSLQQQFFYLENFGAAGVDIFFVISGFIITVISRHYAAEKVPGYFFMKRFVRIAPVYWLVSLLPLILLIVNNTAAAHLPNILKTIFFLPFLDQGFFDEPLLSAGWTLSFEMFFYLVVFGAMRISSKWFMQLTIFFMIVLVAVNYATTVNQRLLLFFGNAVVLEFLMGVAVGLLFLSPVVMRTTLSSGLLITGSLALLSTAIFGYGNISESWGIWNKLISFHRVLLWGIPAAIIVTGLVFKEKKKGMAMPWLWTLLGDASYSIYLTHIPFLFFMYAAWGKFGATGLIPPDLLIVVSMLITVSAGCLFYTIVELPMLRLLNRWLGNFMGHQSNSIHKITGIPGGKTADI